MSKKKIAAKPKRKRACFGCGGAAMMCDSCGEPEGICDCEGLPTYSEHDECFGTGIAFLDIEESDLDKEKIAAWKKARKEEGI